MLCAIHQSNFLPRLSTLAKLYATDIWIILDDVQFTRRDYQHRCYVAPVTGTPFPGRWLTIPVHLPSGRATRIKDVRLAEPALTAKRTSGILRHYYRHVPHRSDILNLIPGIEETIMSTERLADVSEHATITLIWLLNWPGAICRSSDIPAREGRYERLTDLTRAVGAATHLCGPGGSRYLDPAPFAALGLAVAMVTSPQHATDLSHENARRVSAPADLAMAGPERLSTAMREHARLSRDVGTWHVGRRPDQRLETAGLCPAPPGNTESHSRGRPEARRTVPVTFHRRPSPCSCSNPRPGRRVRSP